MKILIIGGSRFVGPLLVHKLVKQNHDVTLFNRGTHKVKLPTSVSEVVGNRNIKLNVAGHFNVVIDMCAYNGNHTEAAINNLSFDFFIHFGSVASYKKTEVFPLDEKSETGFWPFMGDYSKGKVECEYVLEKSGIKYATIRPTYILGANNYVDREKFIYSKLKNGEEIILPGNGQAVTQYVFAEDVANILCHIVEKQATGAYNCAGDELVTLKGLVEMMADIQGTKPNISYNTNADGSDHNEDEFPFANENLICNNRRSNELGYSYIKLYDGLKSDYLAYYKSVI